eukprot:gene5946-9775_t
MGNSQTEDKENKSTGISERVVVSTYNMFQREDPEMIIKKKLNKAQMMYDPDELDEWTDSKSLQIKFNEYISEDKKAQAKFHRDKHLDDPVYVPPPYDYKCKVIFSEINDGLTDFQKSFVPSFMVPFGFCHAGLKIGPWYLEWNNSSLVDYTGSVYNLKKSILVIDIPMTKSEEQMIEDVCNIVTEWNTKKYYDKKTINCQHFTMKLVQDGLGVPFDKIPFSKPIQNIISNLKNQGNFEVESIFKDHEHLKNFKSHKDFDFYLLQQQHFSAKTKEEKLRIEEELSLLKIMDRAFWLNYYISIERLEFLQTQQYDAKTRIENIPNCTEKKLKKILSTIVGLDILNKKFSDDFKQLQILNNKVQKVPKMDEETEKEIKENLIIILEKYITYVDKKLKDYEKDVELYEPITGKEFVKRYLRDISPKDVFENIYDKPDKFPTKMFIVDHFYDNYSKDINNALLPVFSKYDQVICVYDDPTQNFSLSKNFH